MTSGADHFDLPTTFFYGRYGFALITLSMGMLPRERKAEQKIESQKHERGKRKPKARRMGFCGGSLMRRIFGV